MKKIYLMGCDGRVLKMTGRAVFAALSVMLSVEKVYSQRDYEKEEQKRYIGDSYSSILHFITKYDNKNDNLCQLGKKGMGDSP